jgi:glycosyltransferase involved in cell wall biosynthesis
MHTKKKVVILHDWLVGFRGGERVLESFCEMYPEAPIYTLIHKKGSTSSIIESREIITSFLNNIPGIHENYRYFLPLMPIAAMFLKITHPADLVLSSSHCVIKGVRKPEGSVHISFVHSPMRYIYDQFDSYFGESNILVKLAAHLLRPYLQTWDYITNSQVNQFVANSRFVQDRIKKFYHRDSIVVHPFVGLEDFQNLPDIKKENHFLMVSAFAPNKRVDLAIKAFNTIHYKLRIIGGGSEQEVQDLKAIAGSNITFLKKSSRSEVIEEFIKAKAVIFPGIEDFGIVPLESLASGTPLVAYRAGGVLDTLDEKTAIFFDHQTIDDLRDAVSRMETKIFKKEDLIQRAAQFSKEKFEQEISLVISQALDRSAQNT